MREIDAQRGTYGKFGDPTIFCFWGINGRYRGGGRLGPPKGRGLVSLCSYYGVIRVKGGQLRSCLSRVTSIEVTKSSKIWSWHRNRYRTAKLDAGRAHHQDRHFNWSPAPSLAACHLSSGVATDFLMRRGSGSWPEKLPSPKFCFSSVFDHFIL